MDTKTVQKARVLVVDGKDKIEIYRPKSGSLEIKQWGDYFDPDEDFVIDEFGDKVSVELRDGFSGWLW